MNNAHFRLGLLLLLALGSRSSADQPINGEPVTRSDGQVCFLVQGEFRPSIEAARESAYRTAQERLRDWLARQSPPVRQVPSIETIRKEMNAREYSPQEEQILNQSDRMYKITMEVTLSPKMVRELRERERVALGVWVLGLLTGMLAILATCRWIDRWTQQHWTRWLIVTAVLLSTAMVIVARQFI